MKKLKSGFTLVEVSLFLVITAAVFVSVAVGTQNSIFQQRYNDSIQNFAEFLRTAYSQVTNVQNEGTGRSDKAIYGKLIVFREDSGRNKITSYNVIGGIGDIGSGRVLTQLESLGANVVIEKDGGGYSAVGFVEDYTPRWASQIQTTSGWEDDKYDIFTGAVLIVRHPKSGTVYTYKTNNDFVDDDLMDIDDYLRKLNDGSTTAESLLSGSLEDKFEMGDVDFCVNPNGADRSNLRKDIRIVAGARNASGVEIVPDGEDLVEVGGVSLNVGNRCEP
ncbi:MAG: hypothetical protein Q4C24_02325 [Candidatus Saccharibacteria bacterium]|uniref:Prepilin-type N-terminal cleavage/methylation domain-containing protein n=1 Tax=Candidatus Nanosyncoccus alces TaxID=2171997 RepID=A0ABY0FN77_9BACT|nr:hypothetical protein [Candidatus Nanosyncoccus alces]MDO4399106.1 hypothetical protein [Candidatus Saccharibacteria bacterium]RYC74799.1 hypothetical protein G3RUM_00345 [Candidatus Nanosyncoccus alces]